MVELDAYLPLKMVELDAYFVDNVDIAGFYNQVMSHQGKVLYASA